MLVLILCAGLTSYSQKYAYVDSDYILDNIPEYEDAQNQLDDLAVEYQTEIEGIFAEIEEMYRKFQAESVLLPEDLKKKREDEIIQKENEARELQKKRFGREGDLFQKREELVKPIQEKIYNAIEEIAEEKNYAFVFDKAGSLTMLYVNAKFDISDDVLDKVGAVLGTVRREDRVRRDQGSQAQPQPQQQDRPMEREGLNPPGPIRK